RGDRRRARRRQPLDRGAAPGDRKEEPAWRALERAPEDLARARRPRSVADRPVEDVTARAADARVYPARRSIGAGARAATRRRARPRRARRRLGLAQRSQWLPGSALGPDLLALR